MCRGVPESFILHTFLGIIWLPAAFLVPLFILISKMNNSFLLKMIALDSSYAFCAKILCPHSHAKCHRESLLRSAFFTVNKFFT